MSCAAQLDAFKAALRSLVWLVAARRAVVARVGTIRHLDLVLSRRACFARHLPFFVLVRPGIAVVADHAARFVLVLAEPTGLARPVANAVFELASRAWFANAVGAVRGRSGFLLSVPARRSRFTDTVMRRIRSLRFMMGRARAWWRMGPALAVMVRAAFLEHPLAFVAHGMVGTAAICGVCL
jgi:hypothetical protein